MLDLVTACCFGVIGACIGSFLNVVAYRMPRGMSVVWRPSHCPSCGRNIRPRDNLPVFGWLILRGRCRDCAAPISPRYAIVEALMGVAFFILAYSELVTGAANLPGGPIFEDHATAWDAVWNPHWPALGLFAFHAALVSLLMAMALINQDGQRVPWKLITVAAALVAYVAWAWPDWYPEVARGVLSGPWRTPLDAVFGVAFGAAPWIAALIVDRRRGQDSHETLLFNIAAALGAIGGFMGLHAVVRITVAWLAIIATVRLLKNEKLNSFGALAPLWLLALAHIALWNQIATLLG